MAQFQGMRENRSDCLVAARSHGPGPRSVVHPRKFIAVELARPPLAQSLRPSSEICDGSDPCECPTSPTILAAGCRLNEPTLDPIGIT